MLLYALTGAALALPYDPTFAAYDAVLQANVGSAGVRYAAIGPAGLDAALADIAQANLAKAGEDERKAFYINAYNALTLDVVAESWPVASIRDIDGGRVWSARSFVVAGESLTLDAIENQKLRPMGDPRIHAALNCASKGCPPLRRGAYTREGLDQQLDDACRAWVRGAAMRWEGSTLQLTSIFDWYGDDFLARFGKESYDVPGLSGKIEAAVNFLATYADPAMAVRLRAGNYKTAWMVYDWGVNGL